MKTTLIDWWAYIFTFGRVHVSIGWFQGLDWTLGKVGLPSYEPVMGTWILFEVQVLKFTFSVSIT